MDRIQVKRIKDRFNGIWCVRIGSHKIAEHDVADLWMLMNGEEAIKKFLAKLEKDGPYTVAVLKEKFQPK